MPHTPLDIEMDDVPFKQLYSPHDDSFVTQIASAGYINHGIKSARHPAFFVQIADRVRTLRCACELVIMGPPYWWYID